VFAGQHQRWKARQPRRHWSDVLSRVLEALGLISRKKKKKKKSITRNSPGDRLVLDDRYVLDNRPNAVNVEEDYGVFLMYNKDLLL
jgi:hypothetical protein